MKVWPNAGWAFKTLGLVFDTNSQPLVLGKALTESLNQSLNRVFEMSDPFKHTIETGQKIL